MMILLTETSEEDEAKTRTIDGKTPGNRSGTVWCCLKTKRITNGKGGSMNLLRRDLNIELGGGGGPNVYFLQNVL